MGVCPSPECEFMFAFDEDNRKLDCPLCKKSFCLVCRVSPWHSGVRCEQYQAEHGNVDEADKLFNAFASQQKLKQCPKCKYFVEKTMGCNAMHADATSSSATSAAACSRPRTASRSASARTWPHTWLRTRASSITTTHRSGPLRHLQCCRKSAQAFKRRWRQCTRRSCRSEGAGGGDESRALALRGAESNETTTARTHGCACDKPNITRDHDAIENGWSHRSRRSSSKGTSVSLRPCAARNL